MAVRRLSILLYNMKGDIILKWSSKFLYWSFLLGISLWQAKVFLIKYHKRTPTGASLYNKLKLLCFSNISSITKTVISKSWWREQLKTLSLLNGTFCSWKIFFWTKIMQFHCHLKSPFCGSNTTKCHWSRDSVCQQTSEWPLIETHSAF